MTTHFDLFTQAYIEALLWAETDENGEPFDSRFDVSDLSADAEALIRKDCAEFQARAGSLINDNHLARASRWLIDELAGHDFWLTRNHHGAGFWDGRWREPEASLLTDLAHSFGDLFVYAGDDGLIHLV